MRKLIVIIAASLSLFLTSSIQARADFTFGDETIFWDSYFSSSATTYQGKTQNNSDVWGIPDIIGGTFQFTGHYLTGIVLNYEYSTTQGWSTFTPMDWFFDIDSNGRWDYVLKSNVTRESGTWTLYNIDIDFYDKNAYIYSYAPHGYIPRYDHPTAAADNFLTSSIGDAEFKGWLNQTPITFQSYIAEWTFNTPIFLGNTGGYLTYGFTVSCANDVLYGQAPIPTPEPSTLFLLGAGLIGIGAVTRRRRR